MALRARAPVTSAASAIMFGIAPPSPRPVASRASVSVGMSQAAAVSSEQTPNASSDTVSTGLRPIRSASRPPAMAPSSRPTLAAVKNRPSWPGVGFRPWLMPAAATPAAWTSTPSHMAATKQMASVATRPLRAGVS